MLGPQDRPAASSCSCAPSSTAGRRGRRGRSVQRPVRTGGSRGRGTVGGRRPCLFPSCAWRAGLTLNHGAPVVCTVWQPAADLLHGVQPLVKQQLRGGGMRRGGRDVRPRNARPLAARRRAGTPQCNSSAAVTVQARMARPCARAQRVSPQGTCGLRCTLLRRLQRPTQRRHLRAKGKVKGRRSAGAGGRYSAQAAPPQSPGLPCDPAQHREAASWALLACRARHAKQT